MNNRKLNQDKYEMYLPRDLSTVEFNRKINKKELDTLLYLYYHINKWFRLNHHQAIIEFNDQSQYINIDELSWQFEVPIPLNNKDQKKMTGTRYPFKDLKSLTDVSITTNVFEIGINKLKQSRMNPKKIQIIKELNIEDKTIVISGDLIARILDLKSYARINLKKVLEMNYTSSALMYIITESYRPYNEIKNKTRSQWLRALNKKDSEQNRTIKPFKKILRRSLDNLRKNGCKMYGFEYSFEKYSQFIDVFWKKQNRKNTKES